MRRKSERTASKKVKSSPEKKLEKVKRTRTRRGRKQSTSSENESAEESSPVREIEPVEAEKKPPTTPVKEDSPEEAQDQVWHVKAAEGSGDVGEIQKLKICLTRPPSTPERADRSPRSKRKHSRATSSSDSPSVEGVEEKRKTKHRSKRLARESKDDSEKNHDSQEDDSETPMDQQPVPEKTSEITQSSDGIDASVSDATPMSTTNEDDDKDKPAEPEPVKDDAETCKNQEDSLKTEKTSDADTTVASPKAEEAQDSEKNVTAEEESEKIVSKDKDSPEHPRRDSLEQSEILELHAEESKCESSELDSSKLEDVSQKNDSTQDFEEGSSKDEVQNKSKDEETTAADNEVSINEDKTDTSISEGVESVPNNTINNTNETNVVESSEKVDNKKIRKVSCDSEKDKDAEDTDRFSYKESDQSETTQSTNEEIIPNGQAAPIIVNRKRKWGSRPKVTSQKSITISTDVLKEIIPDVKPVEFDEVIEEKKQHKRIETERVDRPVLPKIIIDNTEQVELNRKGHEENRDKENIKSREPLSMNRRISIVKDNDSIIARPPSPPRHKQSNILYITNLVRPFTLPQLKNLLQRTGRIAENGFWIDRIKSKCFVQYENEDQAVETRHALHGVTWPVSNPKTLQVDFSTEEAFEKAKQNEDTDNVPTSQIPGTVEDWLREQDQKRERGELDKPWERKTAMREWDVGKNEKDKEKERLRRDGKEGDRPLDKRRHRSPERSPEPARKFKKKEEEAPAKLLDDLFRKTKTTPCIYWLPLSAETIAVKEEQRRQHMAEHERRLQELRRTQHRRH